MSIYSLADPRSGACRYVGRSRNPQRRARQILAHPHSKPLRRWAAELRAAGLQPRLVVHGDGIEHEWIARLKPDLNVLSGKQDPEPETGPTTALTVRFPDDVLEKLREAAEAEDRALNTVIVRAAKMAMGMPLAGDPAKRTTGRKAGAHDR